MMCYDLSIRYDDVLDCALFQSFSSLKLTSKYGGISTTKLLGEDMRRDVVTATEKSTNIHHPIKIKVLM